MDDAGCCAVPGARRRGLRKSRRAGTAISVHDAISALNGAAMDAFAYRDGILHAEGVSAAALAEAFGTPLYCMSEAALKRHYLLLSEALRGLDFEICFAPKANSSLAVLRVLARLGAGVDAVSEGEIRLALAAGIPAGRIVFEGPGKTKDELEFALASGIGQFNAESEAELRALDAIARQLGLRAPVALRVNPDVEAGAHGKISTGRAGDKFGIPIGAAPGVYARGATMEGLRMVGVAMHIGSQLPRLEPFEAAFRRLAALAGALRGAGLSVDRIDLGGGIGVPYGDGAVPPSPGEYGVLVRSVFARFGARIVAQPGRLIAANAGILLARVLWEKDAGGRRIVVLDAAMNDLLRPALYDAYHPIVPVREPPDGVAESDADVVGPICETGDTFARTRRLPVLAEGDLVAFLGAGAYAASMASEYNSRPRVAEALVSGDRFALTRARTSYAEMLARERVPGWLEAEN